MLKDSIRSSYSPQRCVLPFVSLYNDWAIPRNLFSVLFTTHIHRRLPIPLLNIECQYFLVFHSFSEFEVPALQYTHALDMHSCEKCEVLNQAVLPEGTEIHLFTLEKAGQGEDSCPVLAILYQGVILYQEQWGTLSQEDAISVVVGIRVSKDGFLEADIRKVWEIQPIRIAMVDFYVLPGKFGQSFVPERSLSIRCQNLSGITSWLTDDRTLTALADPWEN